jgi:hypothetical protein
MVSHNFFNGDHGRHPALSWSFFSTREHEAIPQRECEATAHDAAASCVWDEEAHEPVFFRQRADDVL